MNYKIDSIYDLAKVSYLEEGKKEGQKEGVRDMLRRCITFRFPRIAQATLDGILSIADSNVLLSIFQVACTADSLDNFQRDIRGMAPIN